MSNKALSERFHRDRRVAKKANVTNPKRIVSPQTGISSMRRGLLVGGGASVLAVAVFGVMVHNDRPETEKIIPGLLRIVLIDSSDRNSAVQDRLISRIIEQTVLEDIGAGDRVILLGLSANRFEPLEERFNQVSPRRAADGSPWTSNLEQLEETWQREFRDVYVKEARDLREVLEKSQSPFLEALVQIASILEQYDATEKSVIIVSDALQHIRGGLSAYTSDLRRSVLDMPENLTGFYNPEFGGAIIKLVHIVRIKTQRLQGSAHRQWIDRVLVDHGAELEYDALP